MKILSKVSTVFYALVSLALVAVSVTMILYSFYEVYMAVRQGTEVTKTMLNVVGILVVSIAVFDVAAYLIDESVLAQSEVNSPVEARQTLTKFMTIIIIAINLEALVFIFGAGRTDVRTLLYPTLLMLVGVLALLGLGYYQKLSAQVEKQVKK